MDNYIANDNNNPINWNGTNPTCQYCEVELDCFFDFEDTCRKCWEDEDEEEDNNKQ